MFLFFTNIIKIFQFTKMGESIYYKKYSMFSGTPFSIKALSDGVFSWGLEEKEVYFSKNNGEWTVFNSAATIEMRENDIVSFKGNNDWYNSNVIATTFNFDVFGNAMSLIYGDEFESKTNINIGVFRFLFSGCTGLVSAKNLVLPSMNLANECYAYMFRGCTNMVYAPELPATGLSQGCYSCMFFSCRSLLEAPELPATLLVQDCYYGMFKGCSSIQTAPYLPAETLMPFCYAGMFSGCTSMNFIDAEFLTEPSMFYNGNWVAGVSSEGTFVKNENAEWDLFGVTGVPSGWFVVTNELPV